MRSSATEPRRDRWRLILLGHLAVTGVENRVGPVPAASPAPGHATVRLTLSGTGLRRSRPRRHFANVRRCLSPPAVDLMTYSRRRWLAAAWWLSTGTKRLRSVQSPAAGNTGRRCARRCGRPTRIIPACAGDPTSGAPTTAPIRIIPACAGATRRSSDRRGTCPVHPRVWGRWSAPGRRWRSVLA